MLDTEKENPTRTRNSASGSIDFEFNSAVLSYNSNTPGSLVEDWQFGAREAESGLLKIVGVAIDLATLSEVPGIPAGGSGAIVQLHFTVDSMGDAMLTMTSLDGYTTQDGQLMFPSANTAPVAADSTKEIMEGQSVTIGVDDYATDADGDTLTIIAKTDGMYGTVAIADDGMSVTYTPNEGYTGSDDFTYTVSDGMDTDMAMVTVTVTAREPLPPTNTDPVAPGEAVMVMASEGEVEIGVDDHVTDDDGDTLTIIAKTDGMYGTVAIADDGMSVTYTPNEGYTGSDDFTYTVSDGEGGMATVTVMVDVQEVDDGDGDGDGGTSGGGGGCTLNPGARFDPTLISVLALFMGIHFVRRFTRRQSLR